MDVTRSDVSTSVSTQQIQDLPVASRRWIDLAMLTPGTSQDNIRGQFYRGNVNVGAGGREYSNGFVVDGVNNTWAEMGEPRQNFAMDAIQEFKVSTSNYKAEYGLATGGLVSVVTKSGTNQVHGSGLLFFRDASITAKEFFQTTKPDYRRYQYGGTIGGPIVKDKTHFFFAYEGTQEKQFLTVNARGLWPQYQGTFASDQTRWTYNLKLNHQLSQGQSLFFRYGAEDEYRPIITAGGTTAVSNSFDFAVPRKSAVLGHTWVISPRALNDVRFQYAYAKYEVSPPYSHGDWEPADFTARLPLCTAVFQYPSINVGGCGNAQMGPESRWQIKDDFSYLMRGSHQWKVGIDYSNIPFEGDNTDSPLGTWTFPRDTPYNVNDAPRVRPSTRTRCPPTPTSRTKTLAAYLQDDWKAASGLTFNLGLRYDLQLGSFNEDVPELLASIQEKLGRDGSFPLDVSVVQQPKIGRGDFNNFGPRVGLAWDPANNGVMNIHAAYGIFYDNQRTLQNFNELTWPQAKQIIISRPTFPDPVRWAIARVVPHRRRPEHHRRIERHGQRLRAPVQRRRQPHDQPRYRRHRGHQPHQSVLGPRHGRSEPARPDDQGEAVPAVRARQLLDVDGGQQLPGAAAEGRQADVAPLSIPRLLYAEQGEGHRRHQSARGSLRLLPDRALRRGRSAPSPGDERHRPTAGRFPVLGHRRFPLEPAVQPDQLARPER